MARKKRKRQPSHKVLLSRAVKKAIQKYHKLFRLPGWPVYYREVDQIKAEWRDQDCVAGITIDSDNNEVLLHYLQTLKLEAVDQVVGHEFAHWLLDPLECYLQYALPPKSYTYTKVLLESVVEAIALAITQPDRSHPANVIEEEPCGKE